MLNVFISYRRDDSAGHTGRLTDSLEPLLGSGKIFRDVDDIHPGDDFVKAITHHLQSASIVLIVIGKNWLTAKDEQGQTRLTDPNDFVRLEIETALQHNLHIIPVLVDNAVMPKPTELPPSIAAIAYRQALEISDQRWDDDVVRLHKALMLSKQGKGSETEPRKKSSKFRILGLIMALLITGGLLFLLAQRYLLTPDFSGNWYFEGGDYLLIKQDGNRVEVEHIDPAMQTTYDKGNGSIQGTQLEFDLEPLYTTQYRYRVSLAMSWDKESLNGNLVETLSDVTTPLELKRTKPTTK